MKKILISLLLLTLPFLSVSCDKASSSDDLSPENGEDRNESIDGPFDEETPNGDMEFELPPINDSSSDDLSPENGEDRNGSVDVPFDEEAPNGDMEFELPPINI